MDISSNKSVLKNFYFQKLSKEDVKEIKQTLVDNANRYTFKDLSLNDYSAKKLSAGELVQKNSMEFQKFLYEKGIDGNSIKRISQLNFTPPAFLDIKA